MKDEEHLALIREFMVAIAPEVARSKLSAIRRSTTLYDEDELHHLQTQAAIAIAQLTLEWAMHLAGVYRTCYDEALTPQTQDTALAKAFRTQAQKQPPGGPAPGVRPAQEGVDS